MYLYFDLRRNWEVPSVWEEKGWLPRQQGSNAVLIVRDSTFLWSLRQTALLLHSVVVPWHPIPHLYSSARVDYEPQGGELDSI